MTLGADQRVGRDAVERYQALRKEMDAMQAELSKVLGGQRAPVDGESPTRAPHAAAGARRGDDS